MFDELGWKTRKERVDKKLRFLTPPWSIIRHRTNLNTASLNCHAVEEYPTANGPADYALFVKGKLLGIVEAKKVAVGPQNVLEQAKRYSRGAFDGPGNWSGHRVPFLYATNGEVIYFLDMRNEKNLSRQISQFHTDSALEELFGSAADFAWLRDNPVNIERAQVLSVASGGGHGNGYW